MSTTILDRREKIKFLVRQLLLNRELFSALLIVVVGVISFGLGRLSVRSTVAVPHKYVPFTQGAQVGASQSGKISEEITATIATTSTSQQSGGKKYVGSKNGTKYHLPWCSGAAHIAEANKVWFASKEEASRAGYTPAANCKGM